MTKPPGSSRTVVFVLGTKVFANTILEQLFTNNVHEDCSKVRNRLNGRREKQNPLYVGVKSIFMDPHDRAPKKNTYIQTMEMRCYRKILRISYKDHATNEEVRAKIQQATGPHENLLIMVKRRKLQWYGHVSRSSGLAKSILQGTVKGGRRQGRQRKRWEDNMKEWTGLEFAKSQRAVENRGKWRKLVVKSSVVPQRLSRLRDR